MKRLIIAAVGVVGLVVIGLGVASATVWRPDDVLVADTSDGPHTLVTDPGVLDLGGDPVTEPVTVRVTVPDGGQVTLAIGRDTDVEGWVGTEAHGQVTGLASWDELAVTPVEDTTPVPEATDPAAPAPEASSTASPDPGAVEATAVDPAGSDLWVAQATGKGSATLVWPQQEGRWSLIAVSTGASAPALAMQWPREVTTPLLWPAVVVGLVLLLVSVWLFVRDLRRHRRGLDDEWHAVTTGALPTVLAEDVDALPLLTRRQLREAAAARAARPAPRTGEVAQVPPPVDTQVGTTVADSRPLSRRALREGTHTSPTAVVPAAPSSASGERPEASRGVGWTPSSGANVPPSSTDAPDNAVVPASQPGPGQDGAHGRPSWLSSRGGQPSGSAVPERAATPSSAGNAPAPLGGAAPQGAPVGAGGPPGSRPAPSNGVSAPGTGRYAPGAGGPAPRPGAPVAGSGPAEPGSSATANGPAAVPGAKARAPVPAPAPGSPSAHAPDPHAGRPAWLSTTSTDARPEAEPAGSRADAWRRAWGLPPTEGESNSTEPGQTDQEDGR